MQLKTIGEVSTVTKAINEVLKSTAHLGNAYMDNAVRANALAVATKNYSIETVKAAIAQGTFTEEQIRAILSAKGLTEAEIEEFIATNALSVSQAGATASTLGLGTAFKGLGVAIKNTTKAMWTWLTTTPAGWITAAIGATVAWIYALYKLYDALTVTLKEQQEFTEKLQGELSDIESELSDIGSEMQSISDRIKELNAIDAKSFVEQDELDKLIKENELLTNRNMALKEQRRLKQQEVADSIAKEFEKEYGNKSYAKTVTQHTQQQMDEMAEKRARYEELRANVGYITEDQVAEMERLRKELEAFDSTTTSFEGHIQETITSYEELNKRKEDGEELTEKEEKRLEEYRSELVDLALDIEDYIDRYGIDDEISQSWRDLSDSIYAALYPPEYLTKKFDTVFESLSENAQSELKKLAENGTLSVDDLTTDIIEKFSDAGFTAQQIIEQIYSQYGKKKATRGETPEATPLSQQITSSEESLDKFQSAVKSAADAYTTLLSGNYSSSELLDSIQAITKAASDMGESIDWESIAASDNPLQAIQDQIESISESYAESVLSGAGIDTDSKFGQMLANIIQETYKSEAALSSLNTQIDSLQSAYDDLTDIVDSYNKTGYISFDQLQTLLAMEPQYLSCLTDENGQLQLNEAAMSELANKRLDDAEAQAIQQAITELGELALQDEKQAVQENAKAFSDSVDDIADYNAELANTIAEATVGASAIRDLYAAISGAEAKGATNGQINTVLSNLNTKLQLIKSVRNKVATSGFGSVNKSSTGSSGSGSKETDWKSILDKETTLLEKQLEAGLITFDEYVQKRRDIVEKYYRDNKISAEDYYDALEDMYDYQKSIYDKVLSAVKRRFEREIDKINDVIDAIQEQNEVLEKQKDQYDSILSVVNNVYDKEIERVKAQQDAIQDTIDALQDENDERKLALQLEQAKWELYRAQHQRTKKIYNGTEFIYDTDKDAIRDAQENLADLTLEQTVDGLEKEKEALDAVIEELEKYRDLWNEIPDTLEKEKKEQLAIELWGKDYEKYILSNRISDIERFKNDYVSIQKQINDNQTLIDSYNEKVKYYEKLKDQWSDIADAYESAMEDQYAAMVLGASWESDILDGRLDVLNRFKDEYIAIQNAITEAAKNSAQAQAAAQSAGTSGGSTGGNTGGASNTGGTTTTTAPDSAKTQKYATYKHISEGFSSNGQAQSQIVPLGGDGVVQYGNKWYVYKKIRTYNSNGEASSRIIPDGANGIIKAYASGTDHARRGLNLVGEKGTEALIDNDGNVSLVTEPSLIPMQGGETVKNAKETEDLLNPDNIVPVEDSPVIAEIKKAAANFDWSNMQERLRDIMPSYSSMIQLPNMPMPSYDYSSVSRDNNVTVSIGDIHLHEVQNVDTLANDIIHELSNKVNQAMSRR